MKMDFSLNYVWIQATRLPAFENGQHITCLIPQPLMNNVISMAKQYSETQVNLWVDIYGIGGHSETIMKELNDLETAPNITFKALDTIHDYATHSLFSKDFNGFKNHNSPMRQQIDVARLYALKECLAQGSEEAAIYADMNVIVPNTVFDIIEEHGLCTNMSGFLAGDQLFGFCKDQSELLRLKLMPATLQSIQSGKDGWSGHIDVFNCDLFDISNAKFSNIGVIVSYMEQASAVKNPHQSGQKVSLALT